MLFRTKQRKDKLSIYPKSKQNAINITEILSDRWRRSTLRLYMSAILRKKTSDQSLTGCLYCLSQMKTTLTKQANAVQLQLSIFMNTTKI